MTRAQLNNRRVNVTANVAWHSPSGPDHKLIVTYGINPEGKIKEAFCAGFRASTDICALANDACILLSLLLQEGYALNVIAAKLGENRAEGATTGEPASLVGAIARKGVEIENG